MTNEYILADSIEIVDDFPIYIDDNYIDPSTGTSVTFPYEFKYGDNVSEWIAGPSVVYAIKIKVFKSEDSVVKVKTQEYKIKD